LVCPLLFYPDKNSKGIFWTQNELVDAQPNEMTEIYTNIKAPNIYFNIERRYLSKDLCEYH
jgi:hypothetical protein